VSRAEAHALPTPLLMLEKVALPAPARGGDTASFWTHPGKKSQSTGRRETQVLVTGTACSYRNKEVRVKYRIS